MNKIKETLAKQIKTNYLIGVIVLSLLVLVLYSSYAIFTVSVEKKNALNITAGNLYPSITSSSLDKDNRIGVLPGNEVTLDIRLENINSIEARVNLYYKILNPEATGVTIGYLSSKDVPPTEVGYNLSVYGMTGQDSRTIGVKIKNEGPVPAIIEFGTNVGLKHNDLTIPELSSILALFEERMTGAEYLESIFADNTDTMVNDDPDGNIRYMGLEPANYVNFNGELWRIIGVFNVDDGTGKKEKRLKIIRNEAIGSYSWDTSPSTINSGYGINEWSQADLMTLLNEGPYWNRTSGTCYNGQNDVTIDCDFTNTGLSDTAKEMIGNVVWNLGGTKSIVPTASEMYFNERGTDVFLTPKDGIPRTTTWTGKVALAYLSDFGFATGGGAKTDRVKCLTLKLGNYNDTSTKECAANNWLKVVLNSATKGWTLSPKSDSAYHAYYLMGGGPFSDLTWYKDGVHPVVYLNSNVKITGGEGTTLKPYELDL